jgi:hypothetical protein
MTQHRSINQRLARAKSPEAKALTLKEWANSWQQEQMQLISAIGKAIADNDYDTQCILIGELKAVSVKKFEALPKVLLSLLN